MITTVIILAAVVLAEAAAFSISNKLRFQAANLDAQLFGNNGELSPRDQDVTAAHNLISKPRSFADVWVVVPLVILVLGIIAYPLVRVAVLYVLNINIILSAGFWISILYGICAAALSGYGFVVYKSSQQKLILTIGTYLGLIALALGGLTWLVYNPPHAPPDYEDAFYAAAAFPLDETNWETNANILMDQYHSGFEFLFLQAMGIPFMLLAALVFLYFLIRTVYAFFTERTVSISSNLLILVPILAGAGSLCMGVLW